MKELEREKNELEDRKRKLDEAFTCLEDESKRLDSEIEKQKGDRKRKTEEAYDQLSEYSMEVFKQHRNKDKKLKEGIPLCFTASGKEEFNIPGDCHVFHIRGDIFQCYGHKGKKADL